MEYPRDLIGYGQKPPRPRWQGDARIAVQFVLNYEEGGENSILHNDPASEVYLQEIVGISPKVAARDLLVESVYEYGSRAGFWRVMRIFAQRDLPLTIYAVGMALERNPAAAEAMISAGHEIATHGWRWIDYHDMPEDLEREHLAKCVEVQERLTGTRPYGAYIGRQSANSRKIIIDEGGFLYDSDAYNDDLPYWDAAYKRAHLVIPYTLDNNDMKFGTPQGFNSGNDFFTYLKDAFDVLYAEGRDRPKMMSIGLHCRLAGRPGRAAALIRFLDYIQDKPQVWITRRVDIARHWFKEHPYSK